MVIDYSLLLYIYSPVFLIILIAGLKDRFILKNKKLGTQCWPLIPAIFLLIFFLSIVVIIQLYWYYIPILKNYEYNLFNWYITFFGVGCLLSFLTFLFLRYIYNVSILESFNLKFSQFPFILKVCAVLTIINALSIYFLDLNLLLNPQKMDLELLSSLDIKNFILFYFGAVIIAPIAEESIFRGLIYSPLYRKVGRCMAIIVTSLIWTHAHFLPLVPSIGVFIGGLILGWLYDRSGSLIHPIVLHMFKNSWIVLYYK